MEQKITDIHCPQCGAPARFDIIRQTYVCGHCGGQVGISEAKQQKQGFRKIRADALRNSVRQFRLFSASCSGCGAKVVFEENEAVSNCAFCGRSLVRTEYLDTKGLPESVIPFALTEDEARRRLAEWCDKNKGRPEAQKLRDLLPQLKGFYLPYELVRGPVHMKVARMDGGSTYRCEGFMNDEFINRSRQLDNLLLDGMEPFDIEHMKEFDFACVAGCRVKISDITDQELESRAQQEAGAAYKPAVSKTLQTQAVHIASDVSSAVRLPVLLPVYYICSGDLMAAVNGQSGKVCVRAEKVSHYYFLPWWLKAIIATLVFCGALFGALVLGGMEVPTALLTTGMTGIIFIIVNLCVYSDTEKNSFAVESGREIYTSGERTFRRERGGLVPNEKLLKRRIAEPVYFMTLDGESRPVRLKFRTPGRVLRMVLLSAVAMFLPVIVALLLNGFDFQKLNLGGSAAWFCIAVPTVPIYLLKFGIVELYENPWIYPITGKGTGKRWKEKKEKTKITKDTILTVLRVLFVPPVSLGVWFGIISFFVMVYLTAGGE